MYDDDTIAAMRPRMFSIAYRMLGSVSEAEDVVQEAFLRQQRALADGVEIQSPAAYLSTVVTRLAIDELKSARAQRETYVGEWLPEPLLTDKGAADPAAKAEQADSLSWAFLLLLERLSPVERAVFLLHDVFGYGFDEIAEIVGKNEANCRQLASRARRHVEEGKPRFEASRRKRERAGRAVLCGDVRRQSRRSGGAFGGRCRSLWRRRRKGPGLDSADHRCGPCRASVDRAWAAGPRVWGADRDARGQWSAGGDDP